jgi:energy-coupling factor transport system permease protein
MMDITIGRYHHRDSPVHRLDPRTKLLALLFLIVSVFLVTSPWGFLLVASFALATIALSQLPLPLVLRGLRPMIWIFVSIMILHVFFVNGDSRPLFSVGPVKATWKGIHSGVMVSCRFMLIVMSAAILTLTTVPLRLADGIAEMLRPLRKIGLPAGQIPIMMMITLHFIPVLFTEAEKLISAQKLRGTQLAGANLIKKFKNLIPLIVPLLRSSLRKADELAVGMESRCYHGGDRSHLYKLAVGKSDGIALIAAAATIPLTLIINEFIP